jgi:hypothetical protein
MVVEEGWLLLWECVETFIIIRRYHSFSHKEIIFCIAI